MRHRTAIIAGFILLLLAPAITLAAGREIAWVEQFGDAAAGDAAATVDADADGNVYIGGVTAGALPGKTEVAGGPEAFLRKFGPGGGVRWTKQFGARGQYYTAISGVAVDKTRNAVYVVGTTWGALPRKDSSGKNDAFIRKYRTNGSLVWTKQFGTSGSDVAVGATVDRWGNLFIAGSSSGALPGRSSRGGIDVYIRKYSAGGDLVWTHQFGTPRDEQASGVAVGAGGQIYLVGETSGRLPGKSARGGTDIFLRKYSKSLSISWTRQFGTARDDYASDVRVGPDSTVYLGGQTRGSFPRLRRRGSFDGFLQKRGPRGGISWTRQFEIADDLDSRVGVAVDTGGNVYIGSTMDSGGTLKAFARRYGSGGRSKWTRQIKSGRAVAAMVPGGDLYIAGMSAGALFSPPGTSGPDADAFVAKFSR